MNQFKFFRKKTGNINSGPAKKMQLLKKLPEIGAALMVYIGFGD